MIRVFFGGFEMFIFCIKIKIYNIYFTVIIDGYLLCVFFIIVVIWFYIFILRSFGSSILDFNFFKSVVKSFLNMVGG